MPTEPETALIVEESRWARVWPWVLLGAASLTLLIAPGVPLVVLLVGAGWAIRWLQRRRRRPSLAIEGDDIIIVNPYSVHRVPIDGASISVNLHQDVSTGDEDLDQEIRRNAGASLTITPPGPGVEAIPVRVAIGLSPSEFRRVVAELKAAIAAEG